VRKGNHIVKRLGLLVVAAASALASPAMAREDQWTPDDMRRLVAEAKAAAGDGLDPARYGAASATMSPAAAEAYALGLASDLSRGRVRNRASQRWYIASVGPTDADLAGELAAALDAHDLAGWFRSLRPADPSYAALGRALAASRDPVERARLKANLERWRWMPRMLPQGERIVVNVPTYRLSYVRPDGGVDVHDVVVGAVRTPTPQLMADATHVVVNPPWNVPASIARGLRAGRRYRAIATGDGGRRLQQAPGPGNALGQYKIEMPNDHAIYLHDTPAKGLFSREARAYSHGCVRVRGIGALAAELSGSDGSPRDLSEMVAARRTRWLPLGRTVPVMIVYFTAEAQEDGSVRSYPDVYGLDAALARAVEK
jgi:murein L,D-transpeptidase YcbB/YkuD